MRSVAIHIVWICTVVVVNMTVNIVMLNLCLSFVICGVLRAQHVLISIRYVSRYSALRKRGRYTVYVSEG